MIWVFNFFRFFIEIKCLHFRRTVSADFPVIFGTLYRIGKNKVSLQNFLHLISCINSVPHIDVRVITLGQFIFSQCNLLCGRLYGNFKYIIIVFGFHKFPPLMVSLFTPQ